MAANFWGVILQESCLADYMSKPNNIFGSEKMIQYRFKNWKYLWLNCKSYYAYANPKKALTRFMIKFKQDKKFINAIEIMTYYFT